MHYLAERKLIRDDTGSEIVRNEVVLVQSDKTAKNRAITIDSASPIADLVGAGPVAMCNPQSHPAGRYARLRLQEQHLWDAIASKVAIVGNPRIAALMVGRGDATSAVVFATDIDGVAGVRIAAGFPIRRNRPSLVPRPLRPERRVRRRPGTS